MCELASGCSCSSGLTCRVLSEFGSSGLHHPAEAVRKVAERILTLVYRVNPRLVRKQLPPDDDITRRNLLYRQLFHEFDRIDIQVCMISGFCRTVDEKSHLRVMRSGIFLLMFRDNLSAPSPIIAPKRRQEITSHCIISQKSTLLRHSGTLLVCIVFFKTKIYIIPYKSSISTIHPSTIKMTKLTACKPFLNLIICNAQVR